MIIEQAIKNQLQADAAVLALTVERIHYANAPQDTPKPYVVMYKISDVPTYTHGGKDGKHTARIQLSCYGTTYLSVKNVSAAIDSVLSGFKGTLGGVGGMTVQGCFKDGDMDGDYEDNSGLFPVHLDFIFHYEE